MKYLFWFTLLAFPVVLNAQIYLSNLQGQRVELFDEVSKSSEGKPVLVITWANEYCYPCEKILDKLQEDYARLKKEYGLRIITINLDEEESFKSHYQEKHQSSMGAYTSMPAFVRKYKDKKGWTMDHYIDDKKEFYETTKSTGAPGAFIFFDGIFDYRKDGFTIPNHKKDASYSDPEIIQATIDSYLEVIASYTALEKYYSEDWRYSDKANAVYKRSIVKIGNFYEITDSWITGEIQMRGMSEDIAGNKKVMAYKYYYKNGNIESEVVFVDNKKHGVEKTYFEDGKLKESITWVNGVQEGETKSYDDDGGYFTGSYKNGKFDGLWKGFYPDGSPKVENLWQEGRLIEVRFYNSPTGTPLDKGTLINGSGTRKTYNNQGKLESIITYEEGKFVSEYNVD